MNRGLWIALSVLVATSWPAAAAPPSFRNDVMAVLSRGGCNQGACHGNLNGKGGFKLSLRGEDPEFDRIALTRDTLARRVDILHPEESLLLRKATGAVAHEGGPRFGVDSLEFKILHGWIAVGCPADPPDAPTLMQLEATPRQQILVEPADRMRIEVRGRFSDGSARDLSRLAVYETTTVGMVTISADGLVTRNQPGELVVLVRYLNKHVPVQLAFIPARESFHWSESASSNPIDRVLLAQLKSLRLTPSPVSSDSMFLRRAYLDALGILPTEDEARAFLRDGRLDKRGRLIDQLLRRPEFADFWAQKWSDLLHNEEKSLDPKGVRVFHHWLRGCIASEMPLNEFARQIISARGSSYLNPPANFYRSLREPYARTEAVAQVFLGTRLQCAKCHNHPFDRWTQNDYHQFAAFFDGIDYRIRENNRKDKFDLHQFDGEQIVLASRKQTLKHPRTGELLEPRLLGGDAPLAGDNDRLAALADWVAHPDNPFFARSQANRVWYHLLGKGLVDPIDDFRATNPPVNAELLEHLAKQFRASNFNLRCLVKEIMTSRVYGLSSEDGQTNHDDEVHFSKALIRPLEAEQLLDAVCQVLDTRVKFEGYPLGVRAGQMAAPQQIDARKNKPKSNMGEKFLKVFGKPDRLLSCECERSEDAGVMQSFQLLTGELLNSMLADRNNLLSRLMSEGKSNAQIIEAFYLTALSRLPSSAESNKLTAFVAKAKNRREALEDVVWGLVNSKEFLLRR